MFHLLKGFFTEREKHHPCNRHLDETAGLRAELHRMYDQKRALQNHAARLEAENQRLKEVNASLRLHQKDSLIEELADRLLQRKTSRETPQITLPCPHHASAEICFAAG